MNIRITQHLLIAIPLGFLWITLTGHASIGSYAIGYVLGLAVSVLLAQGTNTPLTIPNFPKQALMLVVYMLVLYRDIFVSGVDVTLRVMGIRPTRTGIIAVRVGNDPKEEEVIREIIAGLTAHSITITPGEMVVDFEDDRTMIVHSLDVGASTHEKLEDEQTTRMRLFKRIFGDV